MGIHELSFVLGLVYIRYKQHTVELGQYWVLSPDNLLLICNKTFTYRISWVRILLSIASVLFPTRHLAETALDRKASKVWSGLGCTK